jgi:hypothetical protein
MKFQKTHDICYGRVYVHVEWTSRGRRREHRLFVAETYRLTENKYFETVTAIIWHHLFSHAEMLLNSIKFLLC